MKNYFKILKSNIRRRNIARIKWYLIGNSLLKIYCSKKKRVVYFNGRIIFDNIMTDQKFGPWWKKYKKIVGKNNLEKINEMKALDIEQAELIKKYSGSKKKPYLKKK